MEQEILQDKENFKDFLLKEKRLGIRTTKIYMFYYSHFDPMRLLEKDYIHRFIIKHKNTSVVRAFVRNYCFEFHKIDPDKIELPNKSKKKIKRIYRDLSKDEMTRLKTYFYNKNFKIGLIFDLLYQGALRRFEILAVKLNSFNWNAWLEDPNDFCLLTIMGKGNKEREVLINPETANKIVNYYIKKYDWISIEEIKDGMNRDVLLFSKFNGKPLIEQNIYDHVKRNSLGALKTRDVRPHELRAYRAIELEEMGVPMNEIKEYLGHSKITTTALYLNKSKKKVLSNIKEKLKAPIPKQ